VGLIGCHSSSQKNRPHDRNRSQVSKGVDRKLSLENAPMLFFEVCTYLAHNLGHCVVRFHCGIEIFATAEQAFSFIHFTIGKMMNCVGLFGSLRFNHFRNNLTNSGLAKKPYSWGVVA
jgi:hypothetical protein